MLMTAERVLPLIPAEELDRIRTLLEEGMCFRAFDLARGFGELSRCRGTFERIIVGCLAPHLGAPRLADALHYRAWRDDPGDPLACYYRARNLLARRGPLAAWRFFQSVGPLEDAPDPVRSDWMASHAFALALLRDFDAAETWLARAEKVSPDRPWLLVERAGVYQLEDRYEDALAAARDSLSAKPWYGPAVHATAHLLELLDRREEALEFLTEASERIESAVLLAQRGVLEDNMGRHRDARRTWDRYAERAPLIERRMRRWLAGRSSDAAYGCGDIAAAARLAKESGEPFFVAIAGRLEDPELPSRRVLLDVGFVRQHHQTCAPATLAAIARYWGKAGDHLAVADAICYDGTPNHRERSWAEQNGFLTLEFTVTWSAAVAVLDRGVPFTLTTVETQSAHLQAVIGYDEKRGTLIIRDPTLPADAEALAEPLLARYRSVGPRGLALVPQALGQKLDGLALPEAPLYDDHYRLQTALQEHDRKRAVLAHDALQAAAPGHRLELMARQALAHYDADPAGMLATIEELLKQFPDDVNLRLGQLGYMRTLGRRDERLACYRELCSRPAADPILCRQYAQELQADAREHETAVRLVTRALRARPLDAISIWTLAEARWRERLFDEALELYRFATCLNDKDEVLARSYWAEPWAADGNRAAAKLLAETEGRAAALDLLTRACERFPHNYLLHQIRIELLRDRGASATEPVIRLLLEIHPADAWGHRQLALVLAQQGRHDEAEAAMALASQLEPSSASEAHTRGSVLEQAGRRDEAREAFRDAIRRSADDEYAIARLIDSCDSRAARVEALRFIESELTRQVIFGDGLLFFADRARATLEPDELLGTLRRALAVRPDLWHAWSALIVELSGRGILDEALELAERAVTTFPLLPRIWLDLAAVRRARGERACEIEAISRALRITPGWSHASRQLSMALGADGHFDEARVVLERAISHSPLDAHNHGHLAHALWQLGQKEQAIERLIDALKLEPDYDWAWDNLLSWAQETGRPRGTIELARVLAEALRKSRPALGRRATFAFSQSLGEAKQSSRILKAIKRNRPALRSGTQCWAAAGYCLLTLERHHAAAEWMSDWADRPDVEGWMLKNVVQALRATGNDPEASRASRFAVALPRSPATAFHELWLIVDDLLANPCDAASARLARLDRTSLEHADDRFLLELASCVAAVREATPESRRDAIASAARAISALGRRHPLPRKLYSVLKGCYHRAIELIATEKGGLAGKLWWLWRRLIPPVKRT